MSQTLLANKAKITVINKYHGNAGDSNVISIMRPSVLGNPFVIGQKVFHGDGKFYENTREMVIEKYTGYLNAVLAQKNKAVLAALEQIAQQALTEEGVQLMCCCKPKDCHGDVIKAKVIELLSMIDRGEL